MLSVVLYYAADQKYWDRMNTISKTDEGTAKQRLDSWTAGWNMFKDNPLGVGGMNFLVRFPEYQPETMTRGMYGRAAFFMVYTSPRTRHLWCAYMVCCYFIICGILIGYGNSKKKKVLISVMPITYPYHSLPVLQVFFYFFVSFPGIIFILRR